MTSKSNESAGRVLGGIALAATLLLGACGGSDDTKSNFRASRVVVFGDETSLIVDTRGDANGSKYSVNATKSSTDATLVCAASPVWSQSVANSYGLVFPQCNNALAPVPSPTSRIRAAFGARAVNLATQIDAQQAESALGSGDLATVLVGANDIVAEYQRYPQLSEGQLVANLEALGAEVGRQVNRLAATGAKVLLSTAPDVGVTPFAIAERAAHTDTDRAALLSRLSFRFNALLRATIVNDGRKIGLVLLDDMVVTLVKFPGTQGINNVTQPVCDLSKSELTPPSILDCTTLTLVPNGATDYLWADDRRLSASGQGLLGSIAVSRAQGNAF
jgi:phospholipase/lecithinase/hemolysin